ncbi:MAG: cysteine hydrolase [Deltaproteobacteria bacterium]|nr:cysteine hydrolase [Deltaproteobacteria bacterium]
MTQALLLVDLQKDYFPGGKMELAGIVDAAKQARDLLAEFRRRHWPTYHIQHISVRPGAPFFVPRTPGVEINELITPLPEEQIIEKHFPNGFRDTGLKEKLADAGVKDLVICGAMSHMCIDATTRAAADLGFTCTVIHDACATRDLTFGDLVIPAVFVHGAFMAALSPLYARVVSVEEFLRGL